MGRKRKGRDISGWLVVDKPAGPSSSDVVNKARWALNAAKAGHAGTLDPKATGVLAIAFGEATKTVPFLMEAMKAYDFTLRLGQATSTDDAEGEVIATSDLRPTDAAIKDELLAFIGDIQQVPPQHSAVKVDGERAYALARGGETLDLDARPLFVESLLLTDRPDADHVRLEMVCGKGGYVRSIARDLGAALGCHAHVETLRRIWSGPFDVDTAIPFETLDALAKSPELDAYLQPLEIALEDLPELKATQSGAARIQNGNPGDVIGNDVQFGDTAWASFDGRAIAIGRYQAGMLHPTRVFRQAEVG